MALAEGLIEEIAAGLCRFSSLRVIARALPRGWSNAEVNREPSILPLDRLVGSLRAAFREQEVL
jgi:hypothetical protein